MKKRIENRAMFYGANGYIFQRAKELRDHPTNAERILWQEINKSKLGVRFKRQQPIDRWIADFYCHQHKLVIEIDGGYHNLDVQREKDQGRAAEIKKFGIKILRFQNESILNDPLTVIKAIKEEIKKKKEQ